MYMHRTPSSSSQYSGSPPYYGTNQPGTNQPGTNQPGTNQPGTNQPGTNQPGTAAVPQQIVQNFYVKVAQIVTQARLVEYDGGRNSMLPVLQLARQPSSTKKSRKWFNLDLEDSDVYKEDIKLWRQTVVASTSPPPPMVIEIYLDVTGLAPHESLHLRDETNQSHVVDLERLMAGSTRRNITLESWSLSLSHPSPDPPPDLPVVYKKSIAFFRSLYAYVRLLPAYRLFKKIRKTKLTTQGMKIGHRFASSIGSISEDIGVDVPVIERHAEDMSEYIFDPIDTPLGVFTLSVSYRTNCDFHIDDEADPMISQHLASVEERFFPTIPPGELDMQEPRWTERRRSFPTRMQAAPTTFHPSTSGSPRSGTLMGGTPPARTRSSPGMNPDLDGTSAHPSFQRSSGHQRQPSYGSHFPNYSSPTLSSNPTPRSGRPPQPMEQMSSSSSSSRSWRDGLQPSDASALTRTPNLTMISPFKSPSLSSSPTAHMDGLPSPTFFDRGTSSPLHRSPSAVSLTARNATSSSPQRPLSIGNTNTLSSSVRSTTSSSSSPIKLAPSFSHRYQSNETGGRVSGRRLSRASVNTNRSDDTTSEKGSYNSSFLASLGEDDVREFLRQVDSREPLRLTSGSPTRSDGSTSPVFGSVHRSKHDLSRFQLAKEAHTNLAVSMTSSGLHTSSEQLVQAGIGSDALEPSSPLLELRASSSSSGSHAPSHVVPVPASQMRHAYGSTTATTTTIGNNIGERKTEVAGLITDRAHGEVLHNLGSHENVTNVISSVTALIASPADLYSHAFALPAPSVMEEDMVFAMSELTMNDAFGLPGTMGTTDHETNPSAEDVGVGDVGTVGDDDDDTTNANEHAGDESGVGSSDYGTAGEEAESGSDVFSRTDTATNDVGREDALSRVPRNNVEKSTF